MAREAAASKRAAGSAAARANTGGGRATGLDQHTGPTDRRGRIVRISTRAVARESAARAAAQKREPLPAARSDLLRTVWVCVVWQHQTGARRRCAWLLQ